MRPGFEGGRLQPPHRIAFDDAGDLIVKIAEHRDREAFRSLFLIFAPKVKSYLIRQGANDARAEELAQEALLTVWRKASSYDPGRAGAAAWIFTIARNLRIDALRREQAAMAYTLCPPPEGEAPATPEAEQDGREREMRVRQAMAGLPAEQIAVVQLSFYQDKAHAEIARDLGLPLGTVKSRLRLALARLRGLVGDL